MSRVLGIVLVLLAFLLPVEAPWFFQDSTDAALNGTVVDDGRPASGSLSAQWSLVSGPGTVPGVYTLSVSAHDGRLCNRCQLFR